MNLTRTVIESIEKKYGLDEPKQLNEGITLNEKLSDHMPDWLKKRMLTTKYTRRQGYYARSNPEDMGIKTGSSRTRSEKDPDFGPRPSYANPRDVDKRESQSLFGRMLAAGIDLDKVNVIEGPKPEKRTDPRLKEPNIPIFLFDNNQVYAKGINDQEEFELDPKKKRFLHVPMKDLLGDHLVAFAYIDGNDDSNFTVKQRQADRAANTADDISQLKAGNLRTPLMTKQHQSAMGRGTTRHMWVHHKGLPNSGGWLNVDRSGYVVTPMAEKYKDVLGELKVKKIGDIMDDYANRINNANATLQAEMQTLDIMDPGQESFVDTLKSMLNYLNDAANCYRRCMYSIENYTNSKYTPERQKELLIDFINDDYYYSELRESVAELETIMDERLSGEIDWI